ncbi:hypothetical protein AKO1_007814 [Acrasis kona]|uniref:histidine kinase n=1 Tax=Acrasis kona TaxID=1008807 RepID=A0AAW2YNV8_9EUKA
MLYVSCYYQFISSLLITRCLQIEPDHQLPNTVFLKQRLLYNMNRLESYSVQNKENFLNKYLLISAEYECYVKHDPWTAISLYEQSIQHATANKFINDRAIAHERYSQCVSMRSVNFSFFMLQASFCDYQEWGAKRKTAQMLKKNIELGQLSNNRSTDPIIPDLSTSSQSSSTLDLQGLIRTSQIISTTIDMNALLFNVIKVIMETAGATNGCVIIDDKIEAMCDFNGEISTMCNLPIDKWRGGSKDIIRRVMETKQDLLLGNATMELESDPYVKKHLCKSILCMPILHQNDLRGCLYMNNDLMTDCFKPDNVKVLSILTSQLYGKYFESRMKGMEQLAQVQKKKAEQEEAHRLKQEEFIDRICHEIRNPIQGIVGNCEAMKDVIATISNHPNQVKQLLNSVNCIMICGQYQRVVTDDVLTLSKLELNKIVLDQVPVRISHIISNAIDMNRSESMRKKIDLKCEFNRIQEDTIVVMDGNRLTTVLMNLLTNAIKFTNQGEVCLTCTLHVDNNLEITIRDTGCGMEQSEMITLFNRFSQATQRIYSEYGGSGLGLFISKAIIDLMGGTISVTSDKGVGTEFKILVKVTMASFEQQQSIQNVKVEMPVRRVIDKLKVLVVEDNKINQRVVVRMLEKCACECKVADNGLQGLNIYKEGSFDLVVMDVSMPLMDGYTSSREIRKWEALQKKEKVYIVGLSGNVRDEHREAGLDSGMDDFMSKPIGQKEIDALVTKVLLYYSNGRSK